MQSESETGFYYFGKTFSCKIPQFSHSRHARITVAQRASWAQWKRQRKAA